MVAALLGEQVSTLNSFAIAPKNVIKRSAALGVDAQGHQGPPQAGPAERKTYAWMEHIQGPVASHLSNSASAARSEYRMRLKTEVDGQPLTNTNFSNHAPLPKLREKPATAGLLDLTSPEVMSSEILQSALLCNYAGGLDRPSVAACCHGNEPAERQVARENRIVVRGDNRGSCSGAESRRSDASCFLVTPGEEDAQSDSSQDVISKLTSGKLGTSNLIHLEAGEPIKRREWSKPEVIDFFAQTFAYDLLEDATKPLPGEN